MLRSWSGAWRRAPSPYVWLAVAAGVGVACGVAWSQVVRRRRALAATSERGASFQRDEEACFPVAAAETPVDEALEESFPASDPPSFSPSSA